VNARERVLALAHAKQLIRGGADPAEAVSTALSERRYTYGHPADYLRTAFRMKDALAVWTITRTVGMPARPPEVLPPPLPELPPAPDGLGETIKAEIRRRVFADRHPSSRPKRDVSGPLRALEEAIRTGVVSRPGKANAVVLTPGQHQAIGTSIERMVRAGARPRPARVADLARLERVVNRRRI